MIGRPADESKLSREPAQVRRRLRRKHEKFSTDLDIYQDVAYGKRIEEWDLEELARGRPRASNGKFNGKSPAWITPAVQREAKRRLLEHTFGKLAGHVDQAITAMGNLLVSEEVDDKGRPLVDARTKFAAAAFIIEHMLGKPKALIEIGMDETTRSAIASAIILDDGMPQGHMTIEGDFEEAEEDDDEE